MAKKEETKKKEVKKVTPKKEVSKKEKEVKETKPKKEVKTKEVKKSKKTDSEKILKVYSFFDKYRYAIYGAIGGILATVLVVVIIWPDRIAKLEDGKEPVAQIKGKVVTADELYEDMKQVYSINSLLDKLDNKILEKKYPETEEMNDELKSQAENYYKAYEQYYQMDKETFLSNNGFADEKAFIEYLRLQYRRNKYTEDYAKSLITDNDVNKYYENEVYGDINTKHMLVKVDSSASDEEKKEAEKTAKEIISKLDSGKTFDEVKKEYKDKVTYEELGYKSYNASLEEAYMKEMKNLKNDSYSKTPVETSYGYHVVYRIDQKEKPKLKDIKEQIIEELANKKIADDTTLSSTSLKKMREDAGLKFSDTVLEKKYEAYLSQK